MYIYIYILYIYIYIYLFIIAILFIKWFILFSSCKIHCIVLVSFSNFFLWILESIACFLTGFMRFTQNFVPLHSVEDIIWLQRAHSTFTMLYYLTCNVLNVFRNNETDLFETNICDSIWHYWMCCYVDKGDEKAYFGVRYAELEQNFHAWFDFVSEYEFLVKTVCSRQVKEDWFGFDSFIDMLLSHCSAHILLTVYSDSYTPEQQQQHPHPAANHCTFHWFCMELNKNKNIMLYKYHQVSECHV